MIETAQHTPGPWSFKPYKRAGAMGWLIYAGPSEYCVAKVPEKVDAKHIVRCVNSHDALLAALEVCGNNYHAAAYDAGDKGHPNVPWSDCPHTFCSRDRTTIAVARGES